MSRQKTITKETVEAARGRLYYTSLKIRGIAYLLKNHAIDQARRLICLKFMRASG